MKKQVFARVETWFQMFQMQFSYLLNDKWSDSKSALVNTKYEPKRTTTVFSKDLLPTPRFLRFQTLDWGA